jgi:hypothetical protein
MMFRPDLLLHAAKEQLRQQKAEVVTIPLQKPAARQAQQLQTGKPLATAGRDAERQRYGMVMAHTPEPSAEQVPQRQLQQQEQQQQAGHASLGHAVRPLQPPFMAVYRSGSVVFGGLQEKQELLWLAYFVPPPVRYTEEDVSLFLQGEGGHCM